MRIDTIRSSEAREMCSRPGFLRAWEALHASCPWSTVFQSAAFVTTWYETYRDEYEPLLLAGDVHGGLQGLLPLAVARDGRLVAAGGDQAEYQAWVAAPADSDSFAASALAALADMRVQSLSPLLVLRYMPPGVPMDRLGARFPGLRHRWRTFPRPLLSTSSPRVDGAFTKKSNKSRLKRLAALGPVRFERVRDAESLASVLDRIARHYDARQLDAHGATPFASDPRRRAFLVALLRSGVLHATVLWAGDRFVSSHLGSTDGRVVHLGTMSHDPALEQFSPGKIHLLLLARLLRQEGIGMFDLTPGGDAYKDRFADHHDAVGQLSVYPSLAAKIFDGVQEDSRSVVRAALRAVGLRPIVVKRFFRLSR